MPPVLYKCTGETEQSFRKDKLSIFETDYAEDPFNILIFTHILPFKPDWQKSATL